MARRPLARWSPLTDLAAVDLGDRRRDERARSVLQRALSSPDRSFPKMMFDEAELEGFYRLMNNDAVSMGALLAPHYAAAGRRVAAAQGPVIVAHDTTTFNFEGEGERDGVGSIANDGTSLAAHVALAMEFDGTPLGVLDVQTHTRFEKQAKASTARAPQDRESARWARGVTQAMTRVDRVGRVVHVMDREADAYLLFDALVAGGHDFVIRLSQVKRRVVDDNATALAEVIETVATTTTRDVKLSRRSDYQRKHRAKQIHPARQGRDAHLAIGARAVTFAAGSTGKHATHATLDLHLVRVWEPSPADGEPAVEWLLLTTLPIATAADLEFVVDCYRRRWGIEEFFKALKTGCAYEQRQLESRHALENALALFVPIAAHLLLLRGLARTQPDGPAAALLSPLHLTVLRAISRRFNLTAAPTVRDALFAIAGLGGFLKHNGEPGWQTLSAGYERLLEAVIGWKAAKGLA